MTECSVVVVKMSKHLFENWSEADVSRIVEMAWEDRTPFEAIERQFGINESQTIALMRRAMQPSSFKMWRERVTARKTKHLKKRGFDLGRAHAQGQYKPNSGR